jgi:hypothetical protein
MDLRQEQMLDLAVTSYRENDQSYAGNILKHIKEGDLVLQDQGYFKLDRFPGNTRAGRLFPVPVTSRRKCILAWSARSL